MPGPEDPYVILGVEADASAEEIRLAFRRLALRHHPDRSPGSQERMVAINNAYALLRDPERRRQYDARRHQPVPEPAVPPATPDLYVDADDEEAWLWAEDLDQHAEDWRQMYEEERQAWERLLAARSADAPDRPVLEASLRRTRRAQLALENALRAREGAPPLTEADLEARRAAARQQAVRDPARAGCLAVLPLAVTAALAAVSWRPGAAILAPSGPPASKAG